MKIISEPMVDAAARFMDFLTARQKVVASNLANIDTPGYRVKDLTFNQELVAAVGGKELPELPQASGPANFAVTEVQGLPSKNDGNNVRLDREMTLMSETNIKYNMMVQMLNSRLRILRSAITGGQ